MIASQQPPGSLESRTEIRPFMSATSTQAHRWRYALSFEG